MPKTLLRPASGAGWPLKGLGVASPDHQVGAIFEVLDEDVLMELTLEIHRIFFEKFALKYGDCILA